MTELRLVEWEKWQGAAVRKIVSDREDRAEKAKAQGRSPPRERAILLDFLAISSNFAAHPGFVAFAGMVGGRVAETFWVRVLQFVARVDPLGGVLVGVGRVRMGDLVLGRPWDRVSAPVGARVWRSLVKSGLATETRVASHARRGPRVTRDERDPHSEDLDSDSEEAKSKTAFDVAVDPTTGPESEAVVSPEAQAAASSPPTSPCRCDDGLLDGGSFCGECQAGKDRRRAWKRVRDAERESEARANAARSRPPSEPTRATFELPPRAAS